MAVARGLGLKQRSCSKRTRHLVVELVVQVAVDLLGVSVLAQQAAQHAQPPHPQHLGGQARLARSPPLTCVANTVSGLGTLQLVTTALDSDNL